MTWRAWWRRAGSLVKSFAREPYELLRYATTGVTTMNARITLTWQQSLFSVVVSTITILGTALVVIVGGSLLPFGGQNLIEPCALGRPVIVGPHTYNFDEAAEGAIAAGAAVRVADADEALRVAASLDGERRRLMGSRARAFVEAHRGAVRRLADWIEATAAPKKR